jgi:hypothetical protein
MCRASPKIFVGFGKAAAECSFQKYSPPGRADFEIAARVSRVRGKMSKEALIYSIENKSVHTLMWFFAVFRRKTRKTVGQR